VRRRPIVSTSPRNFDPFLLLRAVAGVKSNATNKTMYNGALVIIIIIVVFVFVFVDI